MSTPTDDMDEADREQDERDHLFDPPAIVSMKPDDPTAIPHAHMDEH